jgi:hypothetical protein
VDASAAKSVGIARVLNKPFQRADLAEAVSSVLGKSTELAK